MTDPLLSVRGLTVTSRDGISLVDDVSFHLAPAETLGIVGESGAGKSITALSIMHLLPPALRVSSGSVQLDGRELSTLGEREMQDVRGDRIGMVFQEPLTSLNPAFTVGDQVAEALRRHRDIGRRAAWRAAVDMLGVVGIAAPARRARDYPHAFSGGMRQRVMIAMALCCEPQLLLADEPTTALDVTVQRQILDLLVRLRDDIGMAIVLVTHDLGVVAEVCDRVVVMYAGQVVEEGRVEAVFEIPRHPYTAGLMAALPESDRTRPLVAIPGAVPPPGLIPPGCRFHPRCAHAVSGVCDGDPPPLLMEGGRATRCVRADELTLRGVK